MTLSPCRNICQLDPAGKACLGCGRTLDEIAGWAAMSDEQQRAVLWRLERSGRARGKDSAADPLAPVSARPRRTWF